MNRLFLKSIAVLGTALMLMLVSCKEEDPAKPLEVDMEKYATIKGTVLINRNYGNPDAQQRYAAIDGNSFILTASIANRELNRLAQYEPTGNWTHVFKGNDALDGGGRIYDGETGIFEIRVPVGENSTNVKLVLSDVITDWYRHDAPGAKVKARWRRMGSNEMTVSVVEGKTLMLDDWILYPEEIEQSGSLVD